MHVRHEQANKHFIQKRESKIPSGRSNENYTTFERNVSTVYTETWLRDLHTKILVDSPAS
jgi:hypothetical protein